MIDLLGLFGGGVLTLGGVVFQAFEVPERITYGGQHQLTVHKLPGGARVFDTLGPDPAPVTWSGIMLGAGCEDRRNALQEMRDAGDIVDLAFSDMAFQVLVNDCSFDEGFKQIGYRISCTILPDVPDDNQGDDPDTSATDTPSTPAEAKASGQAKVTKARAATKSIPAVPSYGTLLG